MLNDTASHQVSLDRAIKTMATPTGTAREAQGDPRWALAANVTEC